MTEVFRGGSSNNLSQEYREREKYMLLLQESEYDLLDTLYDKKLYGFINKDFEVVAPVNNMILFGDYSGQTQGPTFVVDMFNQFRQYYLRQSTISEISIPMLVEDLKPAKTYVNYEDNYQKYIQNSYSLVLTELNRLLQSRPVSFQAFVEAVSSAVFTPLMSSYAVTKSGYLLSKDSSVHETGLYINMAPSLGLSQEGPKADFIRSTSFECYVNFASLFGFYVDAHAPWRLAVNLDSSFTRNNILNGRPPQHFYDLYSDMYTKKVGIFDDFDSVKTFYQNLYIDYHAALGMTVFTRSFFNVPVSKWLECLLINKFRELGLIISPEGDAFFQDMMIKVLNLNEQYGMILSTSGPVSFINQVCATELRRIVTEGRN
jgi:hypothetical protein